MKGIVVDASIAASWLLDDEQCENARQILIEMQAGVPIFVPNLWLLEITNLLFNAERRKRINRNFREDALSTIVRLPLILLAAPTLADLKIISHYAEKYQLTAYDAEYLRVAKEQRLVLASLDGKLLAAAKREKVPIAGPH